MGALARTAGPSLPGGLELTRTDAVEPTLPIAMYPVVNVTCTGNFLVVHKLDAAQLRLCAQRIAQAPPRCRVVAARGPRLRWNGTTGELVAEQRPRETRGTLAEALMAAPRCACSSGED